MAAPTSYTELALAMYMHATLREVGEALGWQPSAGDYDEAVNETLLTYGASDIAAISGQANIRRLRTLARVQAWQQVVNATAGDYAFSADGASYHREQVHAQALSNLRQAQTEALAYDPDYRVGVDRIEHKHDPYTYLPEDRRTL